MQHGLLQYDVKVLLALRQAIGGGKEFFNWLIQAGYPELGAFSNFLQDDGEAEQFLAAHGHHWLGLLSHAIDGDVPSRKWIEENLHPANFMFCLACTGDEKAISWLRFMKFDILDLLAQEVSDLRNKQELDRAYPYRKFF